MKHLLLTLFLFQSAIVFSQTNDQTINQNKKVSRYAGSVEMGFLNGRTNNEFGYNESYASPTIQLFNGYKFNRLLTVGISISLDSYQYITAIPVSLGLRGELLKSRVSPIYSLDLGYVAKSFTNNLNNRASVKGGIMVNPGLGIRVNTGNNTALTFSAGYKLQKANIKEDWWNGSIERSITYKRLALRMGFMF